MKKGDSEKELKTEEVPGVLGVMELDVEVKYFHPGMPELEAIAQGDWIDVRACSAEINGSKVTGWSEYISYKAGDFVKVGLGFAMQMPPDMEAHVAPRGSTFKNFGLIQTNSVGVVDNSYCGDNDQWFVPFYALRDGKFKVYDRIAQFRIMPKMPKVNFYTVESLENPDRGGHGSTGVE